MSHAARNTRRQNTRRWKSRVNQFGTGERNESVSDPGRTPLESRDNVVQTGAGPYEMTYDIALGYGMERSIVTP